MLVYLISSEITDPNLLEEIIFHTMKSFQTIAQINSNTVNLFQKDCTGTEEQINISSSLCKWKYIKSLNGFNFKYNLITLISNSLIKEVNLVLMRVK